MTFQAYRGNAFDHTHENKIFNDLSDRLKEVWSQREEPLHLLGNFYVDGREFDALIIKRNALIVLDFKDYGGKLQFSENGPWLIDDQEVRGGSRTNPYHQIRDNKFLLLDYLKREVELQSSPNYGHIAGLCVFHRAVEFDHNSLPAPLSRWFHVTDIDHCLRNVDAIVSKATDLPKSDIQIIIDRLNVPAYVPDGQPATVSLESEPEPPIFATRWTPEQQAALTEVDAWLSEDGYAVQILKGAAHTGKRALQHEALKRIVSAGLSPIIIAPNARLANAYNSQGFSDCRSIYSWLYSGEPSELKEHREIHPVNVELPNPDQEVLVFVESHLLSDEHYATDTVVYGSGFLLQDLFNALAGISPQGDTQQETIPVFALPKMLLLGDPYQLTRGSLMRSFIHGQIFEQRNISFASYELLSQIRRDEDSPEMLDFQGSLVKALVAKKFVRLPQVQGGPISELEAGAHTDQIAAELLRWPKQTAMLCAKNDQAYKVNRGVRRQYLNAKSMSSLTVGDIVDFHNRTPNILADDFVLDEPSWINAGEFGRVLDIEEKLTTRSIRLTGRDSEVTITFGGASIELPTGKEVKIIYLADYLAAEKPELVPDQLVALGIWARQHAEEQLSDEKTAIDKLKDKSAANYQEEKAKYDQRLMRLVRSSHYQNAARLRYAYALTVHRAQTYLPFPVVILDASTAHDTQNFATDSYFRWLYTATVCCAEKLKLLNYPMLTPLSEAIWQVAGAKFAPLVTKNRFYFDKNREPSPADLAQPVPDGFSNPVPELLALYFGVCDQINASDWQIKGITQHQYRERYLLVQGETMVEVDLRYNGKFEVTQGVCKLLAGDSTKVDELENLLKTNPTFIDENIGLVVDEFARLIKPKGWNVIAADEKPHKVYVDLAGQNGNLKVEINVPGKGVVSSIKLHQAENESALARFTAEFVND